jgi:hypothetical protein
VVTSGLDEWSPLRLTEYRTRLTGLLGPAYAAISLSGLINSVILAISPPVPLIYGL